MSLTAHEPPVDPDAVPWHPLDNPGPLDGWRYDARSDEWVRYSVGIVTLRIAAESVGLLAYHGLPAELTG